MSVQQQIIDAFNLANNSDIVLSLNNGQVFFAVEEVDGSALPEYKRDLINSYDLSVTTNLKNRLNSFLNSIYEPTSISSFKNENYFIGKISSDGSIKK